MASSPSFPRSYLTVSTAAAARPASAETEAAPQALLRTALSSHRQVGTLTNVLVPFTVAASLFPLRSEWPQLAEASPSSRQEYPGFGASCACVWWSFRLTVGICTLGTLPLAEYSAMSKA